MSTINLLRDGRFLLRVPCIYTNRLHLPVQFRHMLQYKTSATHISFRASSRAHIGHSSFAIHKPRSGSSKTTPSSALSLSRPAVHLLQEALFPNRHSRSCQTIVLLSYSKRIRGRVHRTLVHSRNVLRNTQRKSAIAPCHKTAMLGSHRRVGRGF